MSSEDKSLESACEQPGPPAPASPATTDKRPRGRPRKDGASPQQRARKKPRSRGKTALEDEDSMDGLEAAEPENSADTDVKEQPAEDGAQTEAASVEQLTPALQRSLSEESERSTASVGVEAKTSEQLCAFCYCGERSLLGQGELKLFNPTPDFILPWKTQNGKDDTESSDVTCSTSRSGKQRGQRNTNSSQPNVVCASVSTQTASDEPASKFWDELCQVGLPDDVNVQALFELTGHCWAHHRCAEWSPDVHQTEDRGLVNVDKAVVSGSTERCAYCKHLGATIKCCEETCSHTYHYPCAAGAGTFQDLSCFSLLCPEHIEQALERSKDDANCALCDSSGDLLDQLFCTTCGQHYHGMCLDIPVTPLKRAGWQCPDCKVCQNCKHSGDDNKMLVCDTCDKGYHTFCLQPVMDSVPTNGWKCKNCRICEECGTRISSQWHFNCLLCDNCFQLQVNLPCPFCEKTFEPDLPKDMLHCQMCKRWIHLDCEKCTENDIDEQFKDDYVCTMCKHVEEGEDLGEQCDGMEIAESDAVCTDEMEVDTGGKITFEEQALTHNDIVSETTAIHVNKGTPQHNEKASLEQEVSHLVDAEEMEIYNSETEHIVPEGNVETSERGKTMALQGFPSLNGEEKDFLQHKVKVVTPEDHNTEPQTMSQVLAVSAKSPEPPPSVGEDDSCSKIDEHFDLAEGHEHISIKKDDPHVSETSGLMEMETPPTSEAFMEACSPLGGKLLKSPADLDSPVTSVDTSKTSVSSSPAVSIDFHSSNELFQSYTQVHSYCTSNALPTTYISVTPKIGMGKPAITKRKFSPGRPRSKQGTWSTNNTVSPPSWSPDCSEGWDIFKTRQLLGSSFWSVKVGRGSGFPAKRRPRGSGLSGRGGRGRSKLKTGISNFIIPGVTTFNVPSYKEEEETSMHNTVVLFSSSDKFTLHQDMCLVCGSFGQGAEGRLLACSQCGQCYHPYCVSIKLTRVILRKGWRCLECTVCEACGKATDPGRLLLCDDCDISYHTYCLDPPLQTVPKGGWKCKWCVSCTNCKAITPGLRCEWQNNYTQCAPCASLSTCPVCCQNYIEEEFILQCRQCDRWSHATCQNLITEAEVESAADSGFDCLMCKPYGTPTPEECDSPIDAQIVPKTREPDPLKTFTQDGVCLTESGLSQLQSLTITVPRRKRSKPKLKLKIINQNSVAVLQTPPDPQSELSRDGEMDDSREGDLMDCDVKSESSPEREPIDDDSKGADAMDGLKKRKRKPYRPGIGGFMVRQRSRTGQGKSKRSLSRKDSSGSVSELLPGREESWSEQMPDTPIDDCPPENADKRKRCRRKKNKLEEIFPAYLQEAFFGRNLLDTSRQSKANTENLSEVASPIFFNKTNMNATFLDPSSDPLLSSAATLTPSKHGAEGGSQDPLADLSEVLNTEDDILGILSDDLAKSANQSAGLDIGSINDESSSLPQTSVTQSSRPLSEDQLDGILSPELDKMVTDGAILGKLYKIPELEGKDVEDLFTAVLSPVATHPPSLPQPPPPSAHPHPPHTQLLPLHNQGDGIYSRMPLVNGLLPPNSHLVHNPLAPGVGLGTFAPLTQPPYGDNREKNPLYGMVNDPTNTWTAQTPVMEAEGDTMSNAQRSTLKWEKEEALGEMATVAPVLYTNVNFPNLKDEFPDWATRVKQIAKLWRKASSQERAPYVQKARDNRAALRINKVQMSNDSMKRQQQDIIEQNSRIDSDMFKDPLKQRESEHEQEWKFRQQMRQKSKQQAKIEATQKLEQVKNEQQQQQQFGSQHHLSQSGSDTPNSGIQSPLTPQPNSGNLSPIQQTFNKELFPKQQMPGTPTSFSDDVFLKPQAPPPTPTRMPLQDSLSLPQPHSPQMFSPGTSNSRPTSPVDPYAKMVGTPRPPPTSQTFPRRNSGSPLDICPSRPITGNESAGSRPSPIRDSSLSPLSSDVSGKLTDSQRSLMASEQFSKPLGMGRLPYHADQSGDGSLLPANNDSFTKLSSRSDIFQRQPMAQTKMSDPYTRPPLTPTSTGSENSPAPFKTPMRPPQSPQDSYGSMTPRRLSADPYERPVLTPRPVDNFAHDHYSQAPQSRPIINEPFAHPPRLMRQHSDPMSQSASLSRQNSQDPYSQPPGTPRPVNNPYLPSPAQRHSSVDPYAQQPPTPRPPPQQIDPYSQPPSTPRPLMGDVFIQPLLNKRQHDPRSVMDPYAQQPGTPRPITSDPYSQPPGTPRPIASDPYSQPPGTPRPIASDPYSQPPGTPRPVISDPYSQPPGTPRPVTSDPYSQPPGTPRPVLADPYSQPPRTPRPVLSDPYSQPPRAAMPGIPPENFSRSPVVRTVLMHNQDPFMQTAQNRSQSVQGTFMRPSDLGPHNSRLGGPGSADMFGHSGGPTHDPYDQPPMTPRMQTSDSFGDAHDVTESQRTLAEENFSSAQGQQFSNLQQGAVVGLSDGQNANLSQADSEEKLRQRQKLRELILRQQQNKNAVRQEKTLADSLHMTQGGHPGQWQQENPNRQNEIFNRPPPPYPGNIRTQLGPKGNLRFPAFSKEQRPPYAGNGQFNRPQFAGDLSSVGMRPPHGHRFGYPVGGPNSVTGHERFLGPSLQMQVPGMQQQMRRDISIELTRPLGNPQMSNSVGLQQHFPYQGMQVQQHNISGQAYIELRHRPPDGRPRILFGPPPNIIEAASQQTRHVGYFPRPEYQGQRLMEPVRIPHPGIANQMQMTPNLEHLMQSTHQEHINPEHQPIYVHGGVPTSSNDSYLSTPSLSVINSNEETNRLPTANQSASGLEEKLDPDDPSEKDLDVKDLVGVEVKDLDDDDLENINLDPDDAKGDELDALGNLETNDPQLDDLLRSGKFDILAYTDPELDLGDKKDIFNEDLDLGVPDDDKLEIQCKNDDDDKIKEQPEKELLSPGTSSSQCTSSGTTKIKTEVISPNSEDAFVSGAEVNMHISQQMEDSAPTCDSEQSDKGEKENLSNVTEESTPLSAQDMSSSCGGPESTPVLTSLLASERSENSEIETLVSPSLDMPSAQTNSLSGVPQSVLTASDQGLEHALGTGLGQRLNPSFSQGSPTDSGFISNQTSGHSFVTGESLPNQPCPSGLPSAQQLILQQNRERPLLLEEQPLLLQDLLDQERQEQQQQRQMQAMIRQRSEPFFPSIDFDAITDPIMKAKMVALKGINKVMAQSNMGMPPMVMNRFPFMAQQMPGAPTIEGPTIVQSPIVQDGSIPPQMIRPNPPNFGPGFVNDSQKKQYEEWLQETQQLLQIQQKFLEEQIGAHRKSKKALSAKQRTAKKAGREFPEEDAEQLKHVTEQQSMVQKQLEQIRKQQKEHTELIEEYRNKQQQIPVSPLMPGVPPQQPLIPGGAPPLMNQQNFPVPQALHPQGAIIPNQPRMPNVPGWQPSNTPRGVPVNAPRMQHPHPDGSGPVASPLANANANPNANPRVEFDDNNPFSETFQERERKERLREQQERQRIQLMQEVDRQRALQQRLELEQQGMVGSDRSLSQMPFFSSELPSDFLQIQQNIQQSPQQQAQVGRVLPQNMQQPINSPPATPFIQTPERRSLGHSPFGQDNHSVSGVQHFQSVKQSPGSIPCSGFTQPRPSLGSGMPSSSPAADHGHSSAQGSGQTLIQVYSEIIPEEKGKKKKTRKKKKDDDTDSAKSPSTPRSDVTAPLTPSISEASTPTVNIPNDLAYQGEHPTDLVRSSTPNTAINNFRELEDPLTSDMKQRLFHDINLQDSGEHHKREIISIQDIKLEQAEGDLSPEQEGHELKRSSALKTEEDKATPHNALSTDMNSPATMGPSGNELLKHLLKNKKQPLMMHQKSDSIRSEEDCTVDAKFLDHPVQINSLHMSENKEQSVFNFNQSLMLRTDFDVEKKKPRNKRIQRTSEKATPRSKKRKKEEEQKTAIYSNSDTFTRIKQQLTLLPLMEPIVGMNFAQFLPYGTSSVSAGSRLLGAFGSASIDGVSDYYSQLIFKQNNLSNPPTPPASLPPTPPPVACQKMVNGFATTEELAGKAAMLGGHVTKVLGPKQFQLPFRSQDDLIARAMTQGPKTVDVPASLPTPPHNNQEELRAQDHCDARDSPDSFVPSSSPESVVGIEISRYPDLSLVKEEPPDPATSPIIPMLPSSTGKGSEARAFGLKTEHASRTLFFGPEFVQAPNGPKSGLISVAITLHPTAAENISGVVAAFADLLQVRIPTSYEVSGAPDSGSVILMNGHRINPGMEYRQQMLRRPRPGSMPPARLIPYGLKPHNLSFLQSNNGYKHHNQNIGESPVLKPSWCCHCKVVVLGSGVRKSVKDLGFIKQEFLQSPGRIDEDMVFCSNNCFLLYSAAQTKRPENKGPDPSATPPSLKEAPPKSCHQYSTNTSMLDVHCLPLLQDKSSPPSSPPILFPSAAFENAKVEAKPDELKVTVKLKPRPRTVHSILDDSRPSNKKWKGMKWKKWNIQIVIPKMPFKPQCEAEIDEFLRRLGTCLRPDPLPKDFRKCCFCHEEGDGLTDGPARLLNLDLDLWVHLNCALWSTEVYETQAGALINVELALRRGLQMKCIFCHKMGATSGCHRLRCTNIYHFTCAIKAQCMFFKDKTMLCPMHKPKGVHEQELTYFAVFRRVYVQRDEVRQIASIVQRGERDHTFRVGSLIFHAIGQLLPQQMHAFHSLTALFPVGYEATRFYWSMRYANRRCRYLCCIEEKDGLPLFVIRVIEQGHEDLVLIDSTPKGAWDKVLEPVAICRKDSEILRLFPVYLKGEDLFGLTVSAVTRIAESLPGVEACENYTFRYGRNPLMELPLAINPTGSARSEPKMNSHVKRFVLRPHTLNSTSTSKSFQSTVTGELNAPYSKQFVHSKSSQYRKMKTEWKSNVYLARSRIQGLGLYAARDIEKHTMVIEYIGTIIRNEVANRKEKLYESQNRGVYMFRIDNDHVIDATLTGGPARYINHSCAPNCVAEVVTFEKGHKIIISSNRRIQKGEELCYDYKFDFEDDQHKIPCHCGAVNCRKWMN
ncbi:histone-lysine N-methyltransferase 2C [Discoglossus pictus]